MIRGKFQLIDNDFIDCSVEQPVAINSRVVYEVIRVIDRVPLFFELHFERLQQSCSSIGVVINESSEKIIEQLHSLSKKNNIVEGNVLLRFIFSDDGKYIINIHFIPHSYPKECDYTFGVKTGLLNAERVNPEAKIVQSSLRKKADEMIATENLYEVLLVDNDNCITEGSRSNVFFVKGDVIFCAPLAKVLKGITLLKVFDICKINSIQIVQKSIIVSELSSFEAAFLTGTSPKILPINHIGSATYSHENNVVKNLISIYNNMITKYIETFK